jgi:hypothetical protein
MKMYEGVEVGLHYFGFALDEAEQSDSLSSGLIPRKITLCTHRTGGLVGPKICDKSHTPATNRNPVPQISSQ